MSDQKIKIDVRLSLQWQVLQSLQQTEQLDFNNTSVIQLLDILDSHQNHKSLKSISNDNQSHQSDLSRVESKIDLLLMLFTRHQYNKQYANVPNYDVSLTADGCEIKTSESIDINQLVEIEIFFNQNYPEPLVFSGIVVKAATEGVLAIHFTSVGASSQTYLEKFIFRHHRNEVARIKQS
ncbi:MAG: PilZ domain-containing protein [Gammaproteobacteria bacterium]